MLYGVRGDPASRHLSQERSLKLTGIRSGLCSKRLVSKTRIQGIASEF